MVADVPRHACDVTSSVTVVTTSDFRLIRRDVALWKMTRMGNVVTPGLFGKRSRKHDKTCVVQICSYTVASWICRQRHVRVHRRQLLKTPVGEQFPLLSFPSLPSSAIPYLLHFFYFHPPLATSSRSGERFSSPGGSGAKRHLVHFGLKSASNASNYSAHLYIELDIATALAVFFSAPLSIYSFIPSPHTHSYVCCSQPVMAVEIQTIPQNVTFCCRGTVRRRVGHCSGHSLVSLTRQWWAGELGAWELAKPRWT